MALAFITTARTKKAAQKAARFLQSYGIPVTIQPTENKRFALLTNKVYETRAKSLR